jgi:DNA-binding Lrp family transcriptional regulator
VVIRPGASRQQIARALNAAYGDGLLSEETLHHRLDQLLGARVIDPFRLIGDLHPRRSGYGWRVRLVAATRWATRTVTDTFSNEVSEPPVLLALDWTGAQSELLVGRHHECDVTLGGPGVSRRHARLRFRDGNWILQDLESTNGTSVNGVRVGRCAVRPGDLLVLGDQRLLID